MVNFNKFVDFVISQHIKRMPISYKFNILNYCINNKKNVIAEDVMFSYISNNGPKLNFKNTWPKYVRELDLILIPNISHFKSSEEYYYILFHELSHSTMHKQRLCREVGITNPAFEEIVAEFSTVFILLQLGISPYSHSSSFIRKNSELSLLPSVIDNIELGSNIAISVSEYVLNSRSESQTNTIKLEKE